MNRALIAGIVGGFFGFFWSFIGPALGIPPTSVGYWFILFVGAGGIGVIFAKSGF